MPATVRVFNSVEDVTFDESDFLVEFPDEKTNLICPKCQGRMKLKTSKQGKPFYGCTSFPNCRTCRDASSTGAPLATNFGKEVDALRPAWLSYWQRLVSDD